ncbi:MAG: class I SAM-dependent methyltransferase [Planctomycetes bacterium]|nr:class I SAM-dependent methyltransferase [Planctomycetota bacterium]
MTFARCDVLEFYRELPFNYRTAAEDHARAVRNSNPLKAYPPLLGVLNPGCRLLDVGCGAGWLVNASAYHHKSKATGIDFNPVAIARAKEVATRLAVEAIFEVADLFTYQPEAAFDVVTSVGVLHHTDDCVAGIRHVARTMVRQGGYLFIGLYHAHGRKPFIDHFAALKDAGASEDLLFGEFRRLAAGVGPWNDDEVHARSWFRDQVLHPHETTHTLAEILPVLDDLDFSLESTSLNRFGPAPSRGEIDALEREFERHGQRALSEGRYLPGFFVFLARRRPHG